MKAHAIRAGLIIVVLYLACLFWRITMTDAAVMNFHLLSLKTALPGFQGYDALSIVWGAILAFGYGFCGSYLFHAFHNGCCIPGTEKKNRPTEPPIEKNHLVIAGVFIVGLAFGIVLTGLAAGATQGYMKDSAVMMRDGGSGMMQMGQMMMGMGGMMSEKGHTHSDDELTQKGREMMQRGEELRGVGSGMMQRGDGMMQMMGE